MHSLRPGWYCYSFVVDVKNLLHNPVDSSCWWCYWLTNWLLCVTKTWNFVLICSRSFDKIKRNYNKIICIGFKKKHIGILLLILFYQALECLWQTRLTNMTFCVYMYIINQYLRITFNINFTGCYSCITICATKYI